MAKDRDLIEEVANKVFQTERKHFERIEAPRHKTLDQIVAAMRAELAPKFQAVWDAKNPREYHRTGRRVGKTEYLVRRVAALTAMGSSQSMNPYILPTHKSARLVAWPVMKRVVLRHFPDAYINETMSTIQLPVGGTIVLGGCETLVDVGRWYGMGFDIAVVDERGNFPDQVLIELDDEALEPSLMDHGGVFAGAGNPGRVLRGRWYDQTRDERTDTTPLYLGDARDNPFLKQDAQKYFEAVKLRHGWTDESPTYRRQYLGQWVEDAEGLVFPYDPRRNGISMLPEISLQGGVLNPYGWRFVVGVDVGVVDDTAIAVVAGHPNDNREIVVSTEKHTRWITGQLAERLRELKVKYGRPQIVLDTGGMGKLHAEELSRRFGIYVEPAEKREKESAIRVTRDLLLAGRILLIDGACNDALRDEWSVLGWDENKRFPDPEAADHASDAVSYALRRLRHYQTEGIAPPPVVTVEDLAKAARERRMKRINHEARLRERSWR